MIVEEIIGDLEQGFVRPEVPAQLGDQAAVQVTIGVGLERTKENTEQISDFHLAFSLINGRLSRCCTVGIRKPET